MQGYLPRGIDQSYISGFLARELTQAAARAADSSSNSSVGGPSGAVLLSKVVSKYSQLMGVDHLALAVHKLAELQEQGTAGTSEVGAHSRLACSLLALPGRSISTIRCCRQQGQETAPRA